MNRRDDGYHVSEASAIHRSLQPAVRGRLWQRTLDSALGNAVFDFGIEERSDMGVR